MRFVFGVTLLAGLVALSPSFAQPPPRPEGSRREPEPARDASSFVSRLLSFDQDRDDKLSKNEVTDARLHSLFDQADSDDDDIVTKVELVAFFDQESKMLAQAGGRGEPGGGGPGGGGGGRPGGPGGIGGGPGGPGGEGGQGGGPGGRGPGGQGPGGLAQQAAQNGAGGNMPLGMQSRPCEVMPAQLQAALNLTANQRQQLDQIQQDVDARVAKVLNEQQVQQLRQLGVQNGAPNRGGNRPPPNQGGQQPPPQRKQQQN